MDLWNTFSLSDDVIQVVGDVCIQSTGQVPGLTDPVVIFSTEHTRLRLSQVTISPGALTKMLIKCVKGPILCKHEALSHPTFTSKDNLASKFNQIQEASFKT